MKPLVVYMTAPRAIQQSDRYEKYFYLVGHHFKGAELLESRELFPDSNAWREAWPGVLERIDTLVFLRNEEKFVGAGVYQEIMQARAAGKQIYMCVTDKEDKLVLVEWEELRCKLFDDTRNHARFVTMAREKQAS